MRYAIDVAPLGDFGDPLVIQRIASAAEASGWDGLSTWDSLGLSMGATTPDPFVALAGAAAVTERIRLIVSVVALARRRPHLVAQAASTLDRLSGGRLVLGIGAGGDRPDFEAFGETYEAGGRIALLDEGIDLVDRYLRGEQVSHDGRAFVVRDVRVGLPAVQQPRAPIWFGGMRPGGLRRAARWDGWIGISVSEDGSSLAVPPAQFAELVAHVRAQRTSLARQDEPFEIAVFGQAGLGQCGPSDYEAVGATWWLESVSAMRGSVDDVLSIVEAGPRGLAAARPSVGRPE